MIIHPKLITVGVILLTMWIIFAASYRIKHGPIETGIVVAKNHSEAWLYMQDAGNGIIVPINYPESWSLKIQGKRKYTRLSDTTWIEVSRDTFNALSIGDKYP